MNIVLGSNYESVVSETKKLANKTADLRNKLAQIRNKLDDAYDGQIDYDTEIKALEKRLNTQQIRMSNLSSAVSSAFDGLLTVDSKSIEIDNGLKVILEVTKITSSDTFKEISSSIRSIISKYKDSKWADIISSVIPPIGAGGVVIGGAVSVGRIVADVISDAVITTPDEFEDKWSSKLYEDYRAAVASCKVKPQLQVYSVYPNNNKKSGLCNIASMTTLLNRRLALDGKTDEKFTVEEAIKANGCVIKRGPVVVNGTNQKAGYEYSGGTAGSASKKYVNSSGTSYQAVSIGASAFNNNMKKMGITDPNEYIVKLLEEHPEGVLLRNNTANHVAVITDYEIIDGKIQLNVQDTDGYYGPIEGSPLYKQSKNNVYKDLNYISYLK